MHDYDYMHVYVYIYIYIYIHTYKLIQQTMKTVQAEGMHNANYQHVVLIYGAFI